VRRRWTDDLIRRELETFLPELDVWPPYPWFRATGRRGLWQAIARRGGPERFAADYGLPYARNARGLSDAQIRARLCAVLRGSDLEMWPSQHWLRSRGGPQLVAAFDRAGGPARWATELGLPLNDSHRHRRGHRWTPESTAAALESLLADRHSWPNRREFETAGLGGLYAALANNEGHHAMAARYRLPLQRPRRRREPKGRASRAGSSG
jgi:hypothetical protein